MVYTSGDWHVKPGREDEFVIAWHDFAQWTVDAIDSEGQGTLLRDAEDPSHYVSFGTWRDAETVERWRQSEDFRRKVSKIEDIVESMRIVTLDVASQTEMAATASR